MSNAIRFTVTRSICKRVLSKKRSLEFDVYPRPLIHIMIDVFFDEGEGEVVPPTFRELVGHKPLS